MCDADLTKVKCFRCQKFGHISANCLEKGKGKGTGKGVIKGKGKTKDKSKGKARGKGFGKKGKMNELGYGDETDGTDEWYQDDGSWWTDQTWLQTAQVWNQTWNDWDNGWTADWTDQPEQWAQDWTWDGSQEAQVEYESSSQQPAVQSLVLSPLISNMFVGIHTGLVLEPEEEELGDSHSHSDWTDSVCIVSATGLECLLANQPDCMCDNCEFRDLQRLVARDKERMRQQKLEHFFQHFAFVHDGDEDELGSSNSHFSWGNSACVVSSAGLDCLGGSSLFCNCDNCSFKGWQFGREMERDWLRRQNMIYFAQHLPSALHDILPAESYEESVISVETGDACSVVFDEVLGDEVDYSSGSESSVEDNCLWNPDFGWFGCGAGSEDSGFLCGLLQQESVCTTPPNLHEPWFLGLQGEGSTGEAADFSQGLVSEVGGRVVLNRCDTSTFLNVQDTVSTSHELRRYMPVLDPLLSEFFIDGQSEHWWLLDSGASATVMATSSVHAYGAWVTGMNHERFRAANGSKATYLMTRDARCVHVASQHFITGDVVKELLRLKCKPILGFSRLVVKLWTRRRMAHSKFWF
eukprot:s4200_g5.t1